MTAIMRRELNSYFTSPIGYVYLAVFYLLCGFMYTQVIASGYSSMSYVFSYIFTFCMFLVPILTMRLMSEDRKQKTDQLLLTAPVSLTEHVMGKFLAALIVYTLGIAVTILQAFVISLYTTVNWAVFAGSFVGILLLGAACIGIGMFISSLTENQVIAAVAGFAVMLFLSLFDSLADLVSISWLKSVVLGMSFYTRFYDLTLGVLDFADIFFFLSVAAVFIFLTSRVLEKRRWS